MDPPRQLIFKRISLRKLFSGLFINHHHDKVDEIEDDWEYIEVSEQDFSDTGEDYVAGDGEDSDITDFSDYLPCPTIHVPKSVKITILSKANVRQRLKEKVTLLLSIHPNLLIAEALILLQYFKWDVERTQDEWQVHEQKVRKAVGLFEKPIADNSEGTCGHCRESFDHGMMLSVSCGHQFCRSCWKEYIHEAISAGPRCLTLQCPGPSCNAPVDPIMVVSVSSDEDKKKFESYFLKSTLTRFEQEAKWCPASGCEYCLILSSDGGDSNISVTCQCLYRFCWNCTNEAHSPVDCKTVNKWMSEMTKQSENWVLANTTPCPNCQLSMELDSCYKYFERCTSCQHEFCCKCGADLENHTWSENCHEYSCPLDKSSRPTEFSLKEIAKKSLERYNFYYERWVVNESSRADAQADLQLFQEIQLAMICDALMIHAREIDFLIEAHIQIVECWQFLKWMNVYVYFLSEDERAKMPLLEFMQYQAEKLVKQLHKYVGDLKQLLLQGDILSARCSMECRSNILRLTWVTRAHFKKTAMALKAGLPEVVFIPNPSAGQMTIMEEE